MNIEISNEATKRIAEAVGNADPATVNMLLERVSQDKELLVGLASEEVSHVDVEAVKEGIADYRAGRTRPFSEVDAEIREQFGFKPRS